VGAHQPNEEEIVARIREQTATIVSTQHDVMGNTFLDSTGGSRHARFIGQKPNGVRCNLAAAIFAGDRPYFR
jgi:hypothetical protein